MRNNLRVTGRLGCWPTHSKAIALIFLPALFSCGSDGSNMLGSEQPALRLRIQSGNLQTRGTLGTLPERLIVVLEEPGAGVGGESVTWILGDAAGPGAELVNPDGQTDADGLASTGLRLGSVPGEYQVRATFGRDTVTFRATALAQVVSSIELASGNGQTGTVGSLLVEPLVARVLDQFGDAVPSETIEFAIARGSSGSPRLSTESSTTDDAGEASTRLTLGSKNGAYAVRVTGGAAEGRFTAVAVGGAEDLIALTSVSPGTLVEGAMATIMGTNFDPIAQANTVLVDGLQAAIVNATSTVLTVTVPTFDCRPAREVSITAVAFGDSSQGVTHDLQPPAFLDLPVGEQTIIDSPQDFCLQLAENSAGGDRYLIGVSAIAEVDDVLDLELIAEPGRGGAAPLSTVMPRRPGRSRISSAPGAALIRPQRESHGASAPMEIWLARSTTARVERAPMPVPSVGDVVPIRIGDLTGNIQNFCENFEDVQMEVRAVGVHGIVVVDPRNPMDDPYTQDDLDTFRDDFDALFPVLTAHFGEPSDLDGNGRIVIVLTQELNANSGVGGVVFLSDLQGRQACEASNEGELYYRFVPDPLNRLGRVNGPVSRATAVAGMASGAAHEVAHIVQQSRRIAAGGVAMSRWELEGQALLATELVGLSVLGDEPDQDYGFDKIEDNVWYEGRFRSLALYFGLDPTDGVNLAAAPEQCSMFSFFNPDNPCDFFHFYGATWSFLRYLGDRFAAGHPGGMMGFQRDLIGAHPTLAGRDNIGAVLGRSFDSLFVQWAAMLYVDGRVLNAAPELQMTSWNLADIFENFPEPLRLQPEEEGFNAFTRSRAVRAGSTYYLLLSGDAARQPFALRIRKSDGMPLGTALRPRFWAVRVQ